MLNGVEIVLKKKLDGRINHVYLVFCVSVLGILAVLPVLYFLYFLIPHASLQSADLIVDAWRSHLAPKPQEKFFFLCATAGVPAALLLYHLNGASALPDGHVRSSAKFGSWTPSLIAGLAFFPFVGSKFISALAGHYSHADSSEFFLLAVSIFIGAAWCACVIRVPVVRASASRRTLVLGWWLASFTLVLLSVVAWRLVPVESITAADAWSLHMDAAVYALSQVLGGKTLLVDLPSQYGLFPELLAPFIPDAGRDLRTVSGIFAVLQVSSLVAVFFVLSAHTRLISLRGLGAATLVLTTFETVLFIAGYEERYFQYWPIRFFWPAVTILAFHFFAIRKAQWRAIVVSAFGSVALIWNLDSGIFVNIAFTAYLLVRAVFAIKVGDSGAMCGRRWRGRDYFVALVFQFFVVAAVISLFWIYLLCKGGGAPQYRYFLEYQKIFYDLGLMMLPLPRALDPWMVVMGVYLLGIITVFSNWLAGRNDTKYDLVIFLCFLGMGLFIYYQSRAHELNLITVCWPAVVIGTIFSDGILRGIRIGILSKVQVVPVIIFVALTVFSALTLMIHIPTFALSFQNQLMQSSAVVNPKIFGELLFIRENSHPGEECLILSQRQGIYYLESGMVSPLGGPGLVETLLKTDQVRLRNAFLQGNVECVFLGFGPHTDPGLGIRRETALTLYRQVAGTSDGALVKLVPHSPDTSSLPTLRD